MHPCAGGRFAPCTAQQAPNASMLWIQCCSCRDGWISFAPGITPPLHTKPWKRSQHVCCCALGICLDNARTEAPTLRLPRGRQMNRHKAHYLLGTIKHAGCRHARLTRRLFTFPVSWTLSWSLSQLGGNNLPSYLTQKDSQLSAHKHGLCLSVNESSVN